MDQRGSAAASERLSADRHGVRAKELYKYYKPSSAGDNPLLSTEPDTVLTAFVQLVAFRLNCNRALVSLVDRDVQHFIAESTQTTPFAACDTDTDVPEWLRCTTTPRAGRLCERTIESTAPPTGGPACFEVLDLTADPQFKHLQLGHDGTAFRYYCGVPVTSAKGINIGSLFFVDDKPRKPINDADRYFMGVMAQNVMRHLEMLRDQADKRRALNMNMCLAAFVDPEYASRKRKRELSPGRSTKVQNLAREGLMSPTGQQNTGFEAPDSTERERRGSDKPERPNYAQRVASEAEENVKAEDNEHLSAYTRAANLLFESLSIEGGGGVTFMLDTSGGAHMHTRDPTTPGAVAEHGVMDRSFTGKQPASARGQSSSIVNSPRTPSEPYFAHRPGEACEILASYTSDPEITQTGFEGTVSLTSAELARLVKKHPRGKLFTLDPELLLTSTPSGDEDSPQTSDDQFTRTRRRQSSQVSPMEDFDLLAEHFPGARQIAFIPLFDSISDRFAPCFIVNTNPYRTLSRGTDFLYAIAFCNCLQTELSKLATLSADHQKQNFIGSISHELRSPLHGILGSMEFLNDTDCTAFQHSLIDTANSCAVTLLDTISMVLDYSKLNNLERNVNRVKGRRSHTERDKASLLHPSLNIYGYVDLSVITEEVVEGVATGQEFRHIGKFDTADIAHPARSHSVRVAGTGASATRRADVEILIDIKPRASWEFITQPGAFRRIVMNLFGNALKYTQRGHIKVTLEVLPAAAPSESAKDMGKENVTTIVRLTIADTGQGISPQFMRSKLFTPFSQENTLNPGTGLGLSLVKEIVTMLDGDISMKSEVGVGTEVIVQLPMSANTPPGSGDTVTSSTATSAGSLIDRGKDDSLSSIREVARDRTFAFFWRDHPEDTPKQSASAKILRHCITGYFTDWYGFEPLESGVPVATADVIVVDEVDLQAFLADSPKASAVFIVLCTNSSRHASVKAYASVGTLEFVSLPVGPFKLARAIKLGFDKMTATPTSSHSAPLGVIHEVEPVAEALERVTLSPTTPGGVDVNVLQHGSTLAREDSANAQMAMDSTYAHGSSGTSSINETEEGFPFPAAAQESDLAPAHTSTEQKPYAPRTPLATPGSSLARTASTSSRALTTAELPIYETTAASPLSKPGTRTMARGAAISDAATTTLAQAAPRLLLVDDNKVNLRLLQTYMSKREVPPQNISTAEDGQQAVNVFSSLLTTNPPSPPHIVFMDLSMPVMDGFVATRQIRDLESSFCANLRPDERPPPALIIALTGLASSRDQSEAFVSGFDLFVTKPVSFKEVGRLLDNWTANGGARSKVQGEAGRVPYGPVAGVSPVGMSVVGENRRPGGEGMGKGGG